MKSYVFLSLAIIFEVSGSLLLPVSQNSPKLLPTLGLLFGYIIPFYLLTFALQTLSIPLVYSSWSCLGVFLIAVFGKLIFNEPLSWQIIFGLTLIVIGVVIVNSFSTSEIPD